MPSKLVCIPIGHKLVTGVHVKVGGCDWPEVTIVSNPLPIQVHRPDGSVVLPFRLSPAERRELVRALYVKGDLDGIDEAQENALPKMVRHETMGEGVDGTITFHHRFHSFWTASVGKPGYVKQPWRELDGRLSKAEDRETAMNVLADALKLHTEQSKGLPK